MKIVYLILKGAYVVFESHTEGLLISHLFQDDHQSVNLSNQVNRKKVKNYLLYGMEIPSGQEKKQLSMEEKIIMTITKQLSDRFIITEKKELIRRHANIRGVLTKAAESNVAPSIMKEYIDCFDDQPIYMIGDNADLQPYLEYEGLPFVHYISEWDMNVVEPGSIVLIDDGSIPDIKEKSQSTYLLYSLDCLRAGPLLIPGITACLDCYDTYYNNSEHTDEMFPIYHRNFILNFIVNTVYYCINDLYRFMGLDIGLPIRKYYELSVGDLSMTVTDVYKSSTCPKCAYHLK